MTKNDRPDLRPDGADFWPVLRCWGSISIHSTGRFGWRPRTHLQNVWRFNKATGMQGDTALSPRGDSVCLLSVTGLPCAAAREEPQRHHVRASPKQAWRMKQLLSPHPQHPACMSKVASRPRRERGAIADRRCELITVSDGQDATKQSTMRGMCIMWVRMFTAAHWSQVSPP